MERFTDLFHYTTARIYYWHSLPMSQLEDSLFFPHHLRVTPLHLARLSLRNWQSPLCWILSCRVRSILRSGCNRLFPQKYWWRKTLLFIAENRNIKFNFYQFHSSPTWTQCKEPRQQHSSAASVIRDVAAARGDMGRAARARQPSGKCDRTPYAETARAGPAGRRIRIRRTRWHQIRTW